MYNNDQLIGEGSTARIYMDVKDTDYVYKVSKVANGLVCRDEFNLQRDANAEVFAAPSDYISVPRVTDMGLDDQGRCQIRMERVIPLCASSNNAYTQVHAVLNHESRDITHEGSGDYLGRLEVLKCIENVCGARPNQKTLDFLAEKAAQLISIVQFGSQQTAADTEMVLGFTGGDNCYKLYLLDFDKSNRWTTENDYVVKQLAKVISDKDYYPIDDIERYDIFWDTYIKTAESYGYENMARKVQQEVLNL